MVQLVLRVAALMPERSGWRTDSPRRTTSVQTAAALLPARAALLSQTVVTNLPALLDDEIQRRMGSHGSN